MTWHPPITWQVDQLVTEQDLNEQVRDNLLYLKERVDTSFAFVQLNEPQDFTTTSTTFVDVKSDRLTHTMATTGLPVAIGFTGFLTTGYTPTYVFWDVAVDGARLGGSSGIGATIGAPYGTASFVFIAPNVTAGTHTFTLQWRVHANGYSATLFTGTGIWGVRPQFWVKEL